jgi:hypothetical protein
MGLAALRQAKADDFVRVEYIENTSDAYIDTLINLKSYNYKFELDCQQTELKSQYAYLMGQEMGYENYRIGFYTNLNLVYAAVYGNRYKASTVKADEERHKYIYDKNILYVDGVETVRPDTTSNFYNKGNHLFLLRYFQTAPSCKAKIYSCKIYENGELVRDFIPMYQISKDLYGLWDRVKEEFYVSPNGVKFTGGARVVEDANGNLYYVKNYISFAGGGKSLVSIGLKPNETDYYETKWYFAGSGRSNFMGARTKSNNNDYQCYGYSKALHITYDTGNIVNYSVTYTNKAYIFKTYFNKKTNQMYGAIYDANKKLLAQNKVAKRSGTASVDFFIGKQNGLNNYYPPVNSRMYYFKYWRNHNLVRDMIPVQSVETGEYGFFDKVNLKIYYSSGSADFTGA